jgi:hypothetical protein
MSSIERHFNRASSSIFPHLAQFGGIRPPERKRSRFALSLMDREEISRGLVAKKSLRSIAKGLNRPRNVADGQVLIITVLARSIHSENRDTYSGRALWFSRLQHRAQIANSLPEKC